jgi:hypothetical protein
MKFILAVRKETGSSADTSTYLYMKREADIWYLVVIYIKKPWWAIITKRSRRLQQ